MSRFTLQKFCSFMSAASLAVIAAQAQAQELQSQVSFQIVEISEDGTEQLIDRSTVRPGEIIQYVLTHSNNAEIDLGGIAIAAPIPEGVTIALGSQSSTHPAVFEVQAEMEPELPGLEWSTLPAFRTVVDADGTTRKEPVPAEAIAAVRWNMESALPSGETALNTYRVVVN
ncbi:hypothetical protein [Actibacterium sp. D379-3]